MGEKGRSVYAKMELTTGLLFLVVFSLDPLLPLIVLLTVFGLVYRVRR